MTKNRLSDLNDHLFAQIERLSDEGLPADKLEHECSRASAMVAVADQIVRTAAVQIRAVEMISDFDGTDPRPYLTMVKQAGISTTPTIEGRSLRVVGQK